MYCGNCGAAQPDRTRFCTRCGTQLTDTAQTSPEPSPPRHPAEPSPPPAYGPPSPGYPPPGYDPPPPGPSAYDPPSGPSAYDPPPPGPSAYGSPSGGYSPPTAPAYGPPPGYSPPTAPGYGPPSPGYPSPGAPGSGPPRRRGLRAVIAGAAVVVVLAGLAVAGWQEHWPPAVFGRAAPVALTWSAAQAPLPADAASTTSQQASLNDVTCPSAQNCMAVGYYTTSSNSNTRPLVETFSHGTWTPAAVAPDLAAAGQTTFAYLDGISCDAVGSCVAVGGYFDSKNIEKPLVEGLYGGTWASGNAALPGDADQSKSAYLSDVSCPARGSCVATGWYTDQNGDSQGLIDTMSGGTWHAARAPLPAGAASRKASSANLPTAVYLLRCPAVGSCVATGHYTDQHGDSRGLIETLSGGTWTAISAPLPADAAANPVGYIWTIACPASGTCLAVGSYIDRNGQNRSLAETLSGGTWTAADAPYPSDAAASQKWTISQVTGLTADACREIGSCVAAGSYTARTGGVQGLIDTLSAGTWTAARASLPGDAAAAKQYAYFNGAACRSANECVAVGGYKPQNGNTEGLIETGTPTGSK